MTIVKNKYELQTELVQQLENMTSELLAINAEDKSLASFRGTFTQLSTGFSVTDNVYSVIKIGIKAEGPLMMTLEKYNGTTEAWEKPQRWFQSPGQTKHLDVPCVDRFRIKGYKLYANENNNPEVDVWGVPK